MMDYYGQPSTQVMNKMKPTNPNAQDSKPRNRSYRRRERECKVWSGKCGVGSVKCQVWSDVECKVENAEC